MANSIKKRMLAIALTVAFVFSQTTVVLAAIVKPNIPTIVSVGQTTATFSLENSANGNPASTQYILLVSTYDKNIPYGYIQADGTLGTLAQAVKRTISEWSQNNLVKGLKLGASYLLMAQAIITDNTSSVFSDSATFTTLSGFAKPLAPTVVAGSITPTAVSFTLTDSNNPSATTPYEFSVASADTSAPQGIIQADGSIGGIHAHVGQTLSQWGTVHITGLKLGTQYYLRAQAVNADGSFSFPSEAAIFTTLSGYAKPNIPTILSVGQTTATFSLANSANGNPAVAQYILLVSTYDKNVPYGYIQADGTLGTLAQAAKRTISEWSQNNMVKGLKLGTPYLLLAQAIITDNISSVFSDSATFTTLSGFTKPLAPTIVAGSVTPTAASFTLTDSNNPSATTPYEFAIASADTSAPQGVIQTDGSIGSIHAHVGQTLAKWGMAHVTGLKLGTQYYLRAQAVNADGSFSFPSEAAIFTTPLVTTQNAATPQTPTVKAITKTSAVITLPPDANDQSTDKLNTLYRIKITINNGLASWNVKADGTLSAALVEQARLAWGNLGDLQLANLIPNTIYSVSTAAKNSTGVVSPFSPAVSFTTLPADVNPVDGTTATPTQTTPQTISTVASVSNVVGQILGNDQVTVSWTASLGTDVTTIALETSINGGTFFRTVTVTRPVNGNDSVTLGAGAPNSTYQYRVVLLTSQGVVRASGVTQVLQTRTTTVAPVTTQTTNTVTTPSTNTGTTANNSVGSGESTLTIDTILPANSLCPTLTGGDLIKVAGNAAIYALNDNLEVLYFPSGDEFKSWNEDDTYSGRYKTISEDCYNSLPLPKSYPLSVSFRPGSFLVKRSGTTQLYAVLPNNTLSKITNAAAEALYGANAVVKTVPNVTWSQYTNQGADITTAKPHEGMTINSNGKTYYVGAGDTLSEVSAAGIQQNRLRASFIRPLPAATIQGFGFGPSINEKADMLAKRVH